MKVEKIVKKYLEDNNYDGLYYGEICGCELDNLFPCGKSGYSCEPGYKHPCDCGDHDFHIGAEKRIAGNDPSIPQLSRS